MLKISDRFELPVLPPQTAPETSPPSAKVKGRRSRPKTEPVTAKPAPVPARAAPAAVSRYKFNLTVALGVFIPVMSLATSKIAGTLAGHGCYALAAFEALIGVAVLAVSLSHLAWAIRDVTGSGCKASWALAVALDCSLVLCELVHVTAGESGINAVCWAVVTVVAVFSMVLNCHAFLNHAE